MIGKADLAGTERNDDPSTSERIQRLFHRVPWLYYSGPNRVSAATQTNRVRRSRGTQTVQDESDVELEHFV